jgi:hypothetical protein
MGVMAGPVCLLPTMCTTRNAMVFDFDDQQRALSI